MFYQWRRPGQILTQWVDLEQVEDVSMVESIPEPTVGRVVYWYAQRGAPHRAAIVADVVAGLTVNLGVISSGGYMSGTSNVRHVSEVDPPYGPYWDWMPYQKGQAAKTEKLQTELDKSRERLEASLKAANPLRDVPTHLVPNTLAGTMLTEEQRSEWDKRYDSDFNQPGGPAGALRKNDELERGLKDLQKQVDVQGEEMTIQKGVDFAAELGNRETIKPEELKQSAADSQAFGDRDMKRLRQDIAAKKALGHEHDTETDRKEYNQAVDEANKNQCSTPSPIDGKR